MNDTKKVSFLDLQLKKIWPKVYRFIYQWVQNREEAEDLTQETMRRIYPKLSAGEVESEKFEAYAITSARNTMREEWRRRMRRPREVSVEEMRGKGWEPAFSENEGMEDAMLVKHALNALKDDHKEILSLRIIEGYSCQETAIKMKRSSGAVRALQLRAVQALKKELEKGGYFNE